MLKADWEKTQETVPIDEHTIRAIAHHALPDNSLLSYQFIAGGCANLNIKLQVANQTEPLILRIYLRDKEAAFREQKLAELMQGHIPVPAIYSVGDYQHYRYALSEYVHGKTLRDVILDNNAQHIDEAVYAAGKMVAALQHYSFPIGGFFDADLHVKEALPADGYREFFYESLQNPIAEEQLGTDMILHLSSLIERYTACFPDNAERSLVHADYDPSNMLVTNLDGIWKIAAILDWEFAFAGSYLWDVANMLRYAHKLPASYEQSFLAGLKDGGITLPDNWQITVRLVTLLSLLDCLVRSSPEARPRQCDDIRELIGFNVGELERL